MSMCGWGRFTSRGPVISLSKQLLCLCASACACLHRNTSNMFNLQNKTPDNFQDVNRFRGMQNSGAFPLTNAINSR